MALRTPNNMFCKNCGLKLNSDRKFCTNCGVPVLMSKSFSRNAFKWLRKYKIGLIAIGSFILVIVIISLIPDGSSKSVSPQNRIASSVVNILCLDGENGSGGSGTIIDTSGLVLTNAHIVPQDKKGNPTTEECLITLPDPTNGNINEAYLGKPILFPDVSSEYDLAFIKIDKEYVDEDGTSYGTYPKEFPSFFTNGCENDSPRLGEAVRVYGYPAISGDGYYLTITDGTVSSLPDDGTIYTSAKISHGNSGGLAVDEKGCMLGVPSMVSSDENESLGIIYSNRIVTEFLNKLGVAEK